MTAGASTPRRLLGPALALALVLAACAPPAPVGPPPAPTLAPVPTASGDRAADRAAIDRLEQEVRALAVPDGCDTGAACSTVAVGAKACGGPRYWLPYCPLKADAARLSARAAELIALEQAFNRRYGVVSDCSFVVQPRVVATGGVCRAP